MSYKLTTALCMLAAIMLVGCKEPVGIPNYDVHAATLDTVVCVVNYSSSLTGSALRYTGGQQAERYSRTNPEIKWGYADSAGYDHPRQYGFAVFDVPQFSAGRIIACTLHYYVNDCGSPITPPDLVFNWLSGITSWPGTDATLWKAIDTSSYTLTTDAAATGTGWCKVALTSAGCTTLKNFGANGGNFFTGWRFSATPDSGSYTTVTGADVAVSPYIIVVYQP